MSFTTLTVSNKTQFSLSSLIKFPFFSLQTPSSVQQQKKYQIHLKSQSGPIHVLLVNKDAAANSPVVTPVPPPTNDINNHAAIKEGDEPMEISATSKQVNDVNSKVGAVKTEVLESSRGISLFVFQFSHQLSQL